MRKALQDAVGFCRWCKEYRVDPADAAKLRELIDWRAAAETKLCNVPDADTRREERLRDEIHRFAHSMGFTRIDWPGMYPTLTHERIKPETMVPRV